jgi:hypothetical protein
MAALASRIVPGPWLAPMVLAAWVTAGGGALGQAADDAFLGWSRRDATDIVANMRRTDSVGNRLSFRGLKTDRAINYKLRATWLTPDVIRATARAIQLDERLSPADTRRLIEEAETAADAVFFVEIDPNEGSGIIPLDWTAILQPRGLPRGEAGAARGVLASKLREVRALGGLFKRDYAYDAFWVSFRFTPEERRALFAPGVTEVELIVSIQGREGIVFWPVPGAVRDRLGPR